MDLKVEFLLAELRKSGCILRYTGPEKTAIYAVQRHNPGDECRPGILYIADMESEASAPPQSDISILCVEEALVPKLFDKLQDTLILHSQKHAALSRLYLAISHNGTYDSMACICQEIMGNPVLILDANRNLIARSDSDNGFPPDIPLSSELIDLLSTENKAHIVEHDSAIGQRYIVEKIDHDYEIVGFIVVIERETIFSPLDPEYVDLLCAALAGKLFSAGVYKEDYTMEHMVLDLLQNKLIYPSVVKEKIQSLRWKNKDKYYVLAIDKSSQNSHVSVYEALKDILGTELYLYNHYYVAILGCERKQCLHRRDFPELIKFMRQHNLFAALSHDFNDITNLSHYFQQSVKGIEIGMHYKKNMYFYLYENLVISHMLEICKEKINIMDFCHPTTRRLYEYDQLNGTEYLKTLEVYIYSGKSIQNSAELLFIHRNTMYHRVIKLKEDFGIDFDNWRLHSQLIISLVIFAYLGLLDPLEFF